MAFFTTNPRVGAQKRESIFKMDLINVIHYPGVGLVASGTIGTDRHFVYVGMAGHTIVRRIFKNELVVAGPAIYLSMAAGQREPGLAMVKSGTVIGGFFEGSPLTGLYFPTFRGMAGSAIHF